MTREKQNKLNRNSQSNKLKQKTAKCKHYCKQQQIKKLHRTTLLLEINKKKITNEIDGNAFIEFTQGL